MADREFGVDHFEFPCDPEKLPTSVELPIGEMILEAKSLTFEKGKENLDGARNKAGQLKASFKRVAVAQFTVDEPTELRGTPYTHRFYLGTDIDPEAAKRQTWQTNRFCTQLMKMFKMARIGGKTPDEMAAAFPGQKVGVTVKNEISQDGRYPDKHVVRDFWEPGAKPVKVMDPQDELDRALPMEKSNPRLAEQD